MTSSPLPAQRGFLFDQKNCIGCHACESACADKNGLPSPIAYRTVGFVEGGEYPATERFYLSVACNHCSNPVCLKGCPTNAYRKDEKYGAVIQDPERCIGCGYCVWVCPYGAPQLDHEAGRVEKCDLCIDRLDQGLQPACVSACLGDALDFGVITNDPSPSPPPGFPNLRLTEPNIRFSESAHTESKFFSRADSVTLRYLTDNGKEWRSAAYNNARAGSTASVRSHEDPLVAFTLMTQMTIGAMVAYTFLLRSAFSPGAMAQMFPLFPLLIQTVALALSTAHLGKPLRFYRALFNYTSSPVTHEIITVASFYNLLAVSALMALLPYAPAWGVRGEIADWLITSIPYVNGLTSAVGLGAIAVMARLYRIPARPWWNHSATQTSFYATAFILGGAVTGLWFSSVSFAVGVESFWESRLLPLYAAAGLLLKMRGEHRRQRDLAGSSGEADESAQKVRMEYRKVNALMKSIDRTLLVALAAMTLIPPGGDWGVGLWFFVALLALYSEIIGRSLFFVVVSPTSITGPFFGKGATAMLRGETSVSSAS